MYYFSAMEKKEYSFTKGIKDGGITIARVNAILLTMENQAFCLFVNLSTKETEIYFIKIRPLDICCAIPRPVNSCYRFHLSRIQKGNRQGFKDRKVLIKVTGCVSVRMYVPKFSITAELIRSFIS